MKEIWKAVVNFEGRYEISNLGNLRGIDRLVVHKRHPILTYRMQYGRPIRIFINDAEYYRISLRKDDRYHNRLIHRLVAQAFIQNPNNYKEINHKDFDTLNNKVDNLEWCDRIQNASHAAKNGRFCPVRNPNVFKKLSIDQVCKIHALGVTGISQRAIADQFDISQSVVGCILNGTAWKEIYFAIRGAA